MLFLQLICPYPRRTLPDAMTKPRPSKREIDELDLLPKQEALKRADALLRAMLASPPDPYTPKPKKRAKRAK